MPSQPYQILAGPADVYIAARGTAFPAVNAAPGAGWTNLGQTEGGVTVRHTQSIEGLTTDQKTSPVKAIRTEEGLEVEFSIAELTLENYKYAVQAVVTTTAGPPAIKSISLYRGVDVTLYAILIRGDSAYMDGPSQYEIPVVYQAEEPEVEFVKDDKSVLSCNFTAIADLTAATDADRFGRLVMQTS